MSYFGLDQPHNKLFKNQTGDPCEPKCKDPFIGFIISIDVSIGLGLSSLSEGNLCSWNETHVKLGLLKNKIIQ